MQHMPPLTLGEKLKDTSRSTWSSKNIWIPMITSLSLGVVSCWVFESPLIGISVGILCVILWAIVSRTKRQTHGNVESSNFLLSADQSGVISSLLIANKTAVLDGNNIYHFGLQNDVGTEPLNRLVQQMRIEGYRVVCFFDASIYYTLRDNNAFDHSERFSRQILHRLFDLAANEIYIVPSGTQADKYIIETLSHLPKSFAITNDRFRDYKQQHPFLGKDRNWRKGMALKQGELLLSNYRFKKPIGIKTAHAKRQ